MAMPSNGPFQVDSTAAAIDAAALPAAATYVLPFGGDGRCRATISCGSAAAIAARKLASSRARISGRLEGFLAGVRAEVEVARVNLGEHAADLVGRHVRVGAAEVEVLHVPALILVERMEDRVFAAVELERLHAEALAHGEVERRRRLDPFTLQEEIGVAVEYEEVGAHLRGERRRRQVVLYVGVAHARRNARDARARGEQRGLGHTPALVAFEASRAAIGVVEREVLERVVAHAVAHRVVERHGLLALLGAVSVLARELDHLWMGAVDEASRLEKFIHLSSFISLRAPWYSAPFSEAMAS